MLNRDIYRMANGSPELADLGAPAPIELPTEVSAAVAVAAAEIGCTPDWFCRVAVDALLFEMAEDDGERRDAVIDELRQQYRWSNELSA